MSLDYNEFQAYIDGLYADGSLSEQDYNDIINYILANGEIEKTPRDLIQIRRGLEENLPTLAQGELGFTLDTNQLFVGGLNGNERVSDKKIEKISLFVDDFKEKDDNDDTLAFKRIFQYIEENLGGHFEIRLSLNTVYTISQPINFYQHKFVYFTGKGSEIRVSDTVSENSPLPYMFDLSNKTNDYWRGYVTFEDVTFNANNRALKVINGVDENSTHKYGLYHSKFLNVKFLGLKQGGYGIYGLSWTVSVSNCTFLGYGEDKSISGNWRGTAIKTASAANGVFVKDCNFARLERVCEGASIKVVFRDNVIDNIRKAPFKFFGRGLSIIDNYFEACGGESESVGVFGLESVNVNSTIIFTQSDRDWPTLPISLVVENNTFTSLTSESLIALNGAMNVIVRKNNVMYSDNPINSMVFLFGHGIGYYGRTSDIGLKVEENAIKSWKTSGEIFHFKKILDLSVFSTEYRDQLRNIIIKDTHRKTNSRYLPERIDPKFENFQDWTIEEETVKFEKVIKLTKTNDYGDNKINLNEYLEKSKGSYLRIKFFTANTQSGAGLRLYVNDGVSSILYIPSYKSTDPNNEMSEYNSLFYVDENADKLELSINSYCAVGQSIYLKDFIIEPAHKEI